ncbi:AAA family ATPase [Aeromonas popoffii]|uniref:AAA family ATPase n=1 Tax=Aeromonas popoffii TaxID=70856 RepID=A0ABS5GWM3_9GAMM|nr:AAA family ATPase [Aeromonas popoffii]MBR7631530.1 AAA family ATPase [Aeromonas popoffii]
MFFSKELIVDVYAGLSQIDPDVSTGKRATERVSALKYFLATCAGLKGNVSNSISLATNESQNRKEFTAFVGDVVRLFDDGRTESQPYTNNFKADYASKPGFGAGNNFLTTSLKRNGDYPSRPKESGLIVIQDYVVSLHPDWKTRILNYGNFNVYAPALALWLCRFDNINCSTVTDCISQIKDILKMKYGDDVSNLLCEKTDKLQGYLLDDSGGLKLVNDCEHDLVFLCSIDSSLKQVERYRGDFIGQKGENIIYYGAPGTGKSYQIDQATAGYSANKKLRVVFHSEYQNSDFIGGLRPSMDGDNITYRFVPGPFIKAFIMAISKPEEPCALIIEEINRANAAAVFGDVFQLLDRNENGVSEYFVSVDEELWKYISSVIKDTVPVINWVGSMYLPSNLSILATMNSADQGVQPMDSAFKRRWRFKYIALDFDNCPDGYIIHAGIEYEWRVFAQSVNTILMSMNVEEDRLIGPWFLTMSDFNIGMEAVAGKLFVYLWDDVLRHLPRTSIFNCHGRSFGTICADYLKGSSILSEALLTLLNENMASHNALEEIDTLDDLNLE